MYNFSEVSLLITHYKRSKSLENLFSTFEKLNCKFGEVIVSDDGSPEEHLNYIKNVLSTKYEFKLISSPQNKGLGNNINKGQNAVTMPYTLYVQEDFEPQAAFPGVLESAVKYMDDDVTLDLVRFYAYYVYPYLKPFVKDKRFSEMYLPSLALNYTKIYLYSDHPHLRRTTFFSRFGKYLEGLKGDKTEYWMCISVLQNKGKGIFYNDFKSLFNQKNTSAEPSTMNRDSWKANDNFFIKFIRYIYRQLKYNYDIKFRKLKMFI